MHRTLIIYLWFQRECVPLESPNTTRIISSRPCFFFCQVKRLSDFCASLDFIHEVYYDVSGSITMEIFVLVAPVAGEIRS